MDADYSKWVIIGLGVMSLITVFYQYIRSRKKKMPLSAQNDVKAKRLWQCDPQAYKRKFGDIDQQLQDNLEKNSKS